VSLHNADGIVPIRLDSTGTGGPENADRSKSKPLTILYPGSDRRDSVRVPLILTGKTPKVIARTSDSHHLLVSNWHSRSVSVLQLNPDSYPYASLVSDVPVSAIPRGIAVDDRRGRSYVAIMGGSTMATIDHRTWKSDTVYPVSSSPRHVVLDSLGRLFVSYNSLGQVACLDAATGKTLFTAATHAQPRTIVLSKNQRFLFATCYSSDHLDVFKVHADRFEKVASLPCAGHPVGVDIFEDRDKLEAWVCSYSNGAIQVYTFKKSNPLK
jgi:DNA-binding beta-propeller fold protein YncE